MVRILAVSPLPHPFGWTSMQTVAEWSFSCPYPGAVWEQRSQPVNRSEAQDRHDLDGAGVDVS